MPDPEAADIAIIGAGAAGLMAAIHAARRARDLGLSRRIVALDGAKHIGAKILVAGGGRCNVTHDVVDERAFAGSSRHAIRKVIRRFDVTQTIAFFCELGVELKREETGKLFPVTDDARTVLDALLRAARDAGVEVRYPWRVQRVCAMPPSLEGGGQGVGERNIHLGRDSGTRASTHPLAPSLSGRGELPTSRFEVQSIDGEQIVAHRIILATGGKSLPKTGSDGRGHELANTLGHSITPRIFPALVPLTLPKDHFLCALSGLSAIATLEVRSGTGKRLASFTDSMLCTHFGLSGPAVLDVSRHLTDARFDDPDAHLVINWLPKETSESVDLALQDIARGRNAISSGRFLREKGLPARLTEALCEQAGVDSSAPSHQLMRDLRRNLTQTITNMPLPITGDRGFAHAEVTAGGVPLSEIKLETMESRVCPGLYIVGEVCDVDGRIGGFNFQWAWSSGHIAGVASAQAGIETTDERR